MGDLLPDPIKQKDGRRTSVESDRICNLNLCSIDGRNNAADDALQQGKAEGLNQNDP